MRSLYIHIPFCESKCLYCDFCSFANILGQRDAYIQKLIEEIQTIQEDEPLLSVFIGGGTPSVLDNISITRIMNAVKGTFKLSNDCEITIECNPNSLTIEKLQNYKKCGINRLSMGVQSMNDAILKSIGRIHSKHDVLCIANEIGKYFDNYSFDIMLGLPNQTFEDIKNTIEELVQFSPKHISMYSLILEEETPLFKLVQSKLIELNEPDIVAEQYDKACSLLSKYGFHRYEISNFAKSNYESKHNYNYWNCGEYYGVGLGAHSYIDGVRSANTISMSEYLSKSGSKSFEEHLTKNEKIEELIMLSLRTEKGLNLEKMKSQFGFNILIERAKAIDKLQKNNLICIEDSYLKICKDKFYISNAIIEELI